MRTISRLMVRMAHPAVRLCGANCGRGALITLLAAVAPANLAAAPVAPVAPQAAETVYKEVNLDELVKKTRSPQRIILNPYPVSFTAKLEALPRAQKAEYLNKAMGMMQMSQPPKVSRAVLLGHGVDGKLPAYIEEAAAERLVKEAKAGETRKFYAFHVYNYSKGPALVVVSFGGRQ